jgi:uncharacterized alpha-E superfamily protein
MLSRVAESLYWMARYLERSENTARLINTTTKLQLDLPRGASFGWDVLLKVAGLDSLFFKFYERPNEADIMRFLIEDERNPSSIQSCIRHARENTRTFREVLPGEIWERVNSLYLYVQKNASKAVSGRGQRYQVLNSVIENRQSIVGLLMGSMSQDIAYQFIKLGRNLERADMTTRIVDVNSAVLTPRGDSTPEPIQERLWMSVLTALSAYQMYRRHVGVHVRGTKVVSYLLTDPEFPRTVLHCLGEIEGCLAALPHHAAPMQAVRRAWRRVSGMKIDGLSPVVLHEYLDQIQTDLATIHNQVCEQYFYLHRQPNMQIATANQSCAVSTT